jgi:Zn-dependent protease with chaperone function
LRLQTKLVNDWIDLDFVAKRTKCIGSLIYFPFVLIALAIVSRSTIFANYAPSLTILISQAISLTLVFSCAIMLWWVARATRDLAKQNLTEGIIRAKDAESNPRLAEQLETLLAQVAQLNKGTFGPLSQQPLVKPLLFPLSSAGWVALIENGTIPGF